jgi:hypothetical protein
MLNLETEIISNVLKKLMSKKSALNMDNMVKECLDNKAIVSMLIQNNVEQLVPLVTVKKNKDMSDMLEKSIKETISKSKVIQASILTIQGITKK